MCIRVAVAIGCVDRTVAGRVLSVQGLEELTKTVSPEVNLSRCFHRDVRVARASQGGPREAGSQDTVTSSLPTLSENYMYMAPAPWGSRHFHTSAAASMGWWWPWSKDAGKPEGTSSAGGDNVSTLLVSFFLAAACLWTIRRCCTWGLLNHENDSGGGAEMRGVR
jgi:hypothetical protein